MSISAQTLHLLMKAGLEGEALLEVVRSVEADTTKKRSGAAERQARYRARKKEAVTCDASPVTQPVTSHVMPTPSRVEYNYIKPNLGDISRTSIPPSPLPSKPFPDGFEEFWQVYPKRDGSPDKKGAFKAFGAALKRVDLETILDGARRFADAMEARGKTGTEFIPQARTWLNGDRWNDRYESASQAQDDRKAAALIVLQKYAAPSR